MSLFDQCYYFLMATYLDMQTCYCCCQSLRSAIITVAFYQFGSAAFSGFEALKVLPTDMWALGILFIVTALSSLASATATFSRYIKSRIHTAMVFIASLAFNTIIWTGVMCHIWLFFTPPPLPGHKKAYGIKVYFMAVLGVQIASSLYFIFVCARFIHMHRDYIKQQSRGRAEGASSSDEDRRPSGSPQQQQQQQSHTGDKAGSPSLHPTYTTTDEKTPLLTSTAAQQATAGAVGGEGKG
ncbi:unnamed protein product [Vitrella brassicaformis CCMP3155]|uniref:Uncharacterized protein n=1 Tax=Vitrella brassicaformis (strain CCMP3155) TaxID=1169540 RepID=A0A0G4EGG2_VITBC|nr:unnamed protein product [Vitrella brassicaformis CCMP3155]|eukprot:CEL95143.1 unnamed protein product [Vitrella brassicaformis CCMP3155]